MPDMETIRTMWDANPDGAGLMYLAKPGKNKKGLTKPVVHIEKGFMKLIDLEKRLDTLSKKFDLAKIPVVLHFRITTHGGTCKELTHPFPVTSSVSLLKSTWCETTLGVAHNGIISSVRPRKGLSDTAEYISAQLAYLYKAMPEFYKNKSAMQMVQQAINSKMAFLTRDGEIYTTGNFINENGILYSNDSYLPFESKWGSYLKTPYGGSWGYKPYSDYLWDDDDAEELATLPEGISVASKLLMPLAWADGSYYIDSDGQWGEGEDMDSAIDSNGELYFYSPEEDLWYLDPCGTAFNVSGMPLAFNPDLADVEMVFAE